MVAYSTPENLGNAINTEGRETFPFIADNDNCILLQMVVLV